MNEQRAHQTVPAAVQDTLFDGEFTPLPDDVGFRGPVAYNAAGITAFAGYGSAIVENVGNVFVDSDGFRYSSARAADAARLSSSRLPCWV